MLRREFLRGSSLGLGAAAKYDTVNPAALRRPLAAGTQLRAFPPPVMEACLNASFELYAETAARTSTSHGASSATISICGFGWRKTPLTNFVYSHSAARKG